jgi:hypothetical protein
MRRVRSFSRKIDRTPHPRRTQESCYFRQGHTRAHIDAEAYREKANGVVAGLDI